MDHKSGSAKHLLIMLACCLIPLGLLGAVLFLQVDLGGLGLIFMMRGMSHNHGQAKQAGQACHEETTQQAEAAKTIAQKGS